MADLLVAAAAEEAHGRRRQMLRTALGPTIAAALADPTVIEVMVNPDGTLWLDRPAKGRDATPASASAAPRSSASSAWSPRHVRREVHRQGADRLAPSCPRPASASRACCRRSRRRPALPIRKPADVLYRLADYVAARIMTPRQAEALAHGGPRAPEHPGRRRHLLGQDHARQRAARRDRRSRRARHHPRGHARAADAPPPIAWRCAPSRASSRWPIWCARRCGCGPTASSSARCAGPKRSTCSRPGTPAIPAASPPCTPTPRRPALYRLEQLVQEAVVTVPRDLIAAGHRPRRLHRRPRRRAPRRDHRRRSPASMPTATTVTRSRSAGRRLHTV